MRTLQSIQMTPEQLAIFSRNQPGVELIRGAAGSGKTTTAPLKLKAQIAAYVNTDRNTRHYRRKSSRVWSESNLLNDRSDGRVWR